MPQPKNASRRDFLGSVARLGAASLATGAFKLPLQTNSGGGSDGPVPKRPMGKTGLRCSYLGLGGYHLGSVKDQAEANEIVGRALDAGINFFDNCWEYHNGLSETRLGVALQGKRDQAIVMTKVCSHGRGKDVAMLQLEESLRRLKTDHVDVWQIHEVVYDNDPDLIFASGGAAEALLQAKKDGKARFIGFTGHKSPAIHLKMLAQDFPFDTIQMPLNCFDATFRSFEKQVLPKANERGLAVFGMKSLGGSGEMVKMGGLTPREGLSYAMSLPVATTISGIDSIEILAQNLKVARGFSPLGEEAMNTLRERAKTMAADGRMELFKTSKKYDGDVGRQQHGYPPASALPA